MEKIVKQKKNHYKKKAEYRQPRPTASDGHFPTAFDGPSAAVGSRRKFAIIPASRALSSSSISYEKNPKNPPNSTPKLPIPNF